LLALLGAHHILHVGRIRVKNALITQGIAKPNKDVIGNPANMLNLRSELL
jgi:hypothetical protein